jgi:hypothetical protein
MTTRDLPRRFIRHRTIPDLVNDGFSIISLDDKIGSVYLCRDRFSCVRVLTAYIISIFIIAINNAITLDLGRNWDFHLNIFDLEFGG